MNFFDFLECGTITRNKVGKASIRRMYELRMMQKLFSMFKWHGLPENVSPTYLEYMLYLNGNMGLTVKDDKPIFFMGGYSGQVNDYGVGTHYTGATALHSFDLKVDDDVTICWNNSLMTPTKLNVKYIADMITEIDISEKILTRNTRLYPIPLASSDKEKNAIIETLRKITDGELDVVLSDNIFKELEESGMNVINLTDSSKIDKIQYLSQFRREWKKEFYTLYGQPLQNINKMAQTNKDEIHGEDTVSFIIPCDMLNHRKNFCEKANSLFNLELSVEFSDTWKVGYEVMQNIPENASKILEKGETASLNQAFTKESEDDANV